MRALRVVITAVIVLGISPARAQRGEDIDRQPGTDHKPVVTSGFDGFPGYFNTGTVDRGRFQVDYLPFAGLRYGLTDEASIRISALPLLMFSRGGYGAGFELRHRIWRNDRFNIVATLDASYVNFGTLKGDDFEFDNYAVSSAFAAVTADWRLSPRHVLALTALAGQVKFGGDQHIGVDRMALATTSADAGMVLLLATQTYFIRGVIGLQWGLGYAPYLRSETRTPAGQQEIDFAAIMKTATAVPIVPRVGIFVRAGRWFAGVSATGIIPSIDLAQTW